MIVSRASMYLTLLGDSRYNKKIISTSIDKYIYTVVNHTPLLDEITARYSRTEIVPKSIELKNERIGEALTQLKILSNVEIGTFASFPVEIGFRSSASYSASLLSALFAFKGNKANAKEIAQLVEKIETKITKNNISSHCSYSATSGGLNSFTIDGQNTLQSNPIFLDFEKQFKFEESLIVYYIKTKKDKTKIYSKILSANSENLDYIVDTFENVLVNGSIPEVAYWLYKGWVTEKSLGFNVCTDIIEQAYMVALSEGCLGGKFIGDITGGCLILVCQNGVNKKIKTALNKFLNKKEVEKFYNYPIRLVQSGVDVLFNTER